MVAMLKANVLPAIDIALANVNNIKLTEMQAKVQAEMQAHALINSAEMKKRMAEAQEMLQDQQKKWKDEGKSRHRRDLEAPGDNEKPKDKQPE